MPNHVENHISLQGDPAQIRTMLKAIQSDEYGIGSVDFNKIIPIPKSLDIEAGSRTDRGLKAYRDFIEVYTAGRSADDALTVLENIPAESEETFLRQRTDIKHDEWELGKTAWNNIRQYGAPTWYDWCVANWGTKWNAYGYDKYGVDYQKGDSLCFQTAWSAPHPILQRLSEIYPDVRIEHMWADEDLGCNCGRRIYFDGEMIDEYIPQGMQATDFALDLWDYDPSDLDLVKNSTETSYLNVEMEEYQLIELFDKPALFTNERLTASDIPQGLYCYHLRQDDDGNCFCTVEEKVAVNHGGSVVTKEPLALGSEKYIAFNDETYPNFLGESITIGQFMRGEFDQTIERKDMNNDLEMM